MALPEMLDGWQLDPVRWLLEDPELVGSYGCPTPSLTEITPLGRQILSYGKYLELLEKPWIKRNPRAPLRIRATDSVALLGWLRENSNYPEGVLNYIEAYLTLQLLEP